MMSLSFCFVFLLSNCFGIDMPMTCSRFLFLTSIGKKSHRDPSQSATKSGWRANWDSVRSSSNRRPTGLCCCRCLGRLGWWCWTTFRCCRRRTRPSRRPCRLPSSSSVSAVCGRCRRAGRSDSASCGATAADLIDISKPFWKRLLIKRVLSQTYCRHRLGALRPSDRDPVACNCCSNRTALRSWWRSTAAVGHWSPALLTLLGKMQAKKREKG